MDLRFATCFVLLLGLCACLENEEVITIHADGSSTLEIAAKGQAADLIDGYVLPLGAPWSASRPELSALVPDLNAADATRQLQRGLRALAATPQQGGNPQPDVELGVRASFASVDDWPRRFAPPSEPYPSAYLERSASLKIETKGGRRLFVFERQLHARSFERYDVFGSMKKNISRELYDKLDHGSESWTASELGEIAGALHAAIVHTALAFADDALLSQFVQGDATLAPTAVAGIRAQLSSALEALISDASLRPIVDRLVSQDGEQEDAAAMDLKRLDSETRDLLRNTLESGLRSNGLPPATRNAIRAELEWHLADYDATSDLGDESFKVTVHMPGVVVGGNYDIQDADGAHWEFKGEDLHDRSRVLRVVSVVE